MGADWGAWKKNSCKKKEIPSPGRGAIRSANNH